MRAKLRELRNDLGIVGIASLVVICLTAAYYISVLKPLEARAGLLRLKVESQRVRSGNRLELPNSDRATRMDEFYGFFNRSETPEEWLAKLYGIALASGLELRTGDYQLADSRYRLERYRVSLPVSGTYAQIRQFLDRTLDELPVVSLDGANLRRKNSNETRVEADLVLTVYLMRK